MAYLKPPLLIRTLVNRIAMRLGVAGVATLAVPGRRTGGEQALPVVPLTHGDATYLVSTRGESEWVRNLRAAGGGELRTKQGRRRFRAEEVPTEQRPPLLDAYQAKAGKAVRPYFAKLPDPADHPVFRVVEVP
jgi:deazaflavin-dependent oxidoreductase (nitroreductase family)